ncbi:DNA translocase FtsK 4TM domain-containing protein [Marinibacterium sp. SX1]|uniref:DNA translocase FtsK n=1 Tax=Marinibacterium sp. SX1 TaxID=3388424 RepID=UPI003D16BDD4
MAYNTRSRDPLLDSSMQAAIERRGKELIGIALVALGLAAMAMILSYTPDDPNWMVSTDAPVQNWLGRPGASIAAPLFMVVGWGSLGFAGIFLAWGLRFLLHRGEERAVGRLIFAPIAVAVLSIYAATLVPGPEWRATHSFGLGGLFGDTAMGALLTLLPVGSHFAVKLTSLVAGLGTLFIGFFVMGFTRIELNRILRMCLLGIVMGYSAILSVLGKGARGAAEAARMRAEMRAQRKAEAAQVAQDAARAAAAAIPQAPATAGMPRAPEYAPDYSADYAPDYGQDHAPEPALQRVPQAAERPAPQVHRPAPAPSTQWAPEAPQAPQDDAWSDPATGHHDPYVQAPAPAPRPAPQPERGGLLSRMPSLIRRAEPEPEPEDLPEPELIEAWPGELDGDGYSDDRIRAKIADVVRSRVQRGEPVAPLDDPTKPLTRGRGRRPQPLIVNTAPRVAAPVAAAVPAAPMAAVPAGQWAEVQPEQQTPAQWAEDDVALPPEPPLSHRAPAPGGLRPEPPLTATAPRAATPPVSAPVAAPVAPVVPAAPTTQPRMSAPMAPDAPVEEARFAEVEDTHTAEIIGHHAWATQDASARTVPPAPEAHAPAPMAHDDAGDRTAAPAGHDNAAYAPAEYDDAAHAPTGYEDAAYAQAGYNDMADEETGYEDARAPAPGDAVPVHRAAAPIPVAEPKKVVQNPVRKPPQPSKRAQAEAQPSLTFEEQDQGYELPPLNLLTSPDSIQRHHLSDEALEENARMLENVLDDYGVKGEIVSVRPGPVVTMYELEPAPGLKASRVIGLADDIARSMSALSARVSTVPGRSVIGIELPNDKREMVVLREILAARDFGDTNMRLPLALGKDIGGEPMVANLAKMPHLLIAGTTGSGKSVAINTMILSLLYKLTPDECRLIMIDPKMLELSVYDGIPHLLSPVVTDPKKAVVALKWTVGEMEERYRKMSKMGVRNIDGYNARVEDALSRGETFSRTVQTGFDDETGDPVFETEEIIPEKMPYIVVIVDEMADLMMVAGKEIEACIQRLAQMARASGIHLIMATQRPSVDVITGTIKANFPTRISFQVTSKVDSRTILGEMGAEQLLGMGDMLYMAGGAKITRCHGPFVSDEEVEDLVNHLKAYGPPTYMANVLEGPDEERESDIDAVLGLGGNTNGEDALYDQAVQIVIKDRKCSTSYIQRKLGIGYNKAARLVEQMEEESLVSPANHVGKREILVPEQQ